MGAFSFAGAAGTWPGGGAGAGGGGAGGGRAGGAPWAWRARGLVEQSLAIARTVEDLRWTSLGLLVLSMLSAFAGDQRADGYAQECRALGEAHGAHWTRSWAMTVLAHTRWQRGGHDEAAA